MPTFVGMTGRHNRRVKFNAGWYYTENEIAVRRNQLVIFRDFRLTGDVFSPLDPEIPCRAIPVKHRATSCVLDDLPMCATIEPKWPTHAQRACWQQTMVYEPY